MKIPSRIKAVIFDVDGLLIDSEPYWEQADGELFRSHGKKHTPEINKFIMGMRPVDIVQYFIEEYGFKTTADKLLEERLAHLYAFLLPNLRLMEGAGPLIQSLDRRGITMAIATSGHSNVRATEIAARLGLVNAIKVIVSGEDVTRGKPHPDVFLRAAALVNISPKHCLVFEDAPNGVLAGKAAGMYVIGVNKDEKIYNKLREAGANEVLYSLSEVQV